MLDDETLRDGLQSPSVRSPTIEQKIDILHHMDRLGIDTADIGLPGAGAKVARDVERLARTIGEGRVPNCPEFAPRAKGAGNKPNSGDPPRPRGPVRGGAVHGPRPRGAKRPG